MKNLKYLLLIFILFITITPVHAEKINIRSNNAVLYNLNDNRIIYEKNKDQKVSIASLTKLMTALVAIENIDNLTDQVSFSQSDYEKLIIQNASSSSLKKDKQYLIEQISKNILIIL